MFSDSSNVFFGGEGLNDAADVGVSDSIEAGAEGVGIGFDVDFTPSHGIEFIDGLTFNNVYLTGDGSHNLLDFSQTTLTAIDWIEGGEGDDIIIGSDQDNDIRGGGYSDLLVGGKGNDILTGDGYSDTFIWLDGDAGGTDILTDFTVNEVKIDLSNLLTDATLGNIGYYLEFIDGTKLELHISLTENGSVEQVIVFQNYDNMVDLAAEFSGVSGNSVELLAELVGSGNGKIIIDAGTTYESVTTRFYNGATDNDDVLDTTSFSGSTFNSSMVFGYGGNDTFEIRAASAKKYYYGDHDINFINGSDGQFDQIKAVESNIDILLHRSFSIAYGIEQITALDQTDVVIGSSSSSDAHVWDFSQINLVNIDAILGGTGKDRIIGSVGDDIIDGGANRDWLMGHDGNDTFLVGLGDGASGDMYFGGNGAFDTRDTFYDQIVATEASVQIGLKGHFSDGNGIDEISAGFDLSGNAWTGVTIEGGSSSEYLDFSTVKLTNVTAINANAKDDFVIGSTGNDTINGGTGNDIILGNDGDDILNGDDGNDTLQGNDGNDVIAGGLGDDTLYGDSGNDMLTGGGGSDLFVWNKGDEGFEGYPDIDHITDFDAFDTLDLSGLLIGESVTTITNYLSFTVEDSHLVLNVTSDGVVGHDTDLQIHFDDYADQAALFAVLPGGDINLLTDMLINNLVIDV